MRVWICIKCLKVWTKHNKITHRQLVALMISNNEFTYTKMFCEDCAN